MALPLLFDARFVRWRLLAFLPFVVAVGWLLTANTLRGLESRARQLPVMAWLVV